MTRSVNEGNSREDEGSSRGSSGSPPSSTEAPEPTGTPQRNDWQRTIIRFFAEDQPDKPSPPFVAFVGSGDPDTIPEEWWQLTPEEAAEFGVEEITEPHAQPKEAGYKGARSVDRTDPIKSTGRKPAPSLALRMSEVEPEPVEWLWGPYIPRRKLTSIEGDPGVGKSWLTMALAAQISRG